ncbi:NAD-dependent epimerase/dehydratase family protein [Streptomyces sp. TRM 70361]|uniref:NAD-dependent epimerase/dehydratase family protein n=1 Tax=Streptomyces sp. TRM 70361 TaxID=3116553 RepID=UPI002E7BB727|nr:NAD-dependent epimerase/dehydratase family protein [Streptomyces sp. TRM 70361]MEE1942750.1 NAD-dependent epimerase/dehydratase family protein [Streptomyces sp. TRM 70361]
MRYLITGGAGFIGSRLGEVLLAGGHSLLVLDDLSTGSPPGAPAAAHGERYAFVRGSVLDRGLVDELVEQCDAVVHLAAAVGVRLVVERTLRSLATNVLGTEAVARAAHRFGRRLLLASTSEVYGKNADVPLREDSDRILGSPEVARWSYSEAKAVDESLVNAYHREQGLESVVVRFFNTVGPGQSPAYGMVIPRLVRQAVENRPLTIYGNGLQTRCFMHVDDAVEGVVRLLEEERSIGGTFNLGSSEEISVLDLGRRVIELTGSNSEITFVPHEEAYGKHSEEPLRRVPDTTRVRKLTGWRPRRSLDDVLRDVISEVRVGSVVAG